MLRAMFEAASHDDELMVVRRLVQLALNAGDWNGVAAAANRIDAAGPDRAMQRVLGCSLFLLEAETRPAPLISVTLRRLLQHLSRWSEARPVALKGRVSGPVLWPETIKARAGRGGEPAAFVCRQVLRRFDTPENQLLKWMVERCCECLSVMPPILRDGVCYFPAQSQMGVVRTSSYIDRVEGVLTQVRRHATLREIATPLYITPEHRRRAGTSLTEEYAEIARAYVRYQQLVAKPSWNALAATGRRVLPLPARLTPEADAWLQMSAAILQTRGAAERSQERSPPAVIDST